MATLHESELDVALARLTPEWLAGFFDGEGSVAIVRQHSSIPSLTVNLSQAEYNILALVGLKFGGERKPYKKYAKIAKRQGWCLAFAGKSALPFLETIRPHVILKRKLVEWAIEMAHLHGDRGELHARPSRKGSGARHMDPKLKHRREELMELVRTENQSGKLPVQ